MKVITLSQQLGSGGEAIAAQVAADLYLEVVDHSRLRRAAVVAGVSELAWAELEMIGRGDLVDRLTKALRRVPPTASTEQELAALSAGLAGPLDGLFVPFVPPAAVALAGSVRILEQVVRHLADVGSVLFVDNGAQMILAGRDDVLHVAVIAPFEQRVAAVQARNGASLTEARRQVRSSDRNQIEYLRRFYQARWDDPLLYHLVVNTGQLTIAQATAAIVAAAREKFSS